MIQMRLPSRPPRRFLRDDLAFHRPSDVLEHARGMLSTQLNSLPVLESWLEERREFDDGLAESLLMARLDFGSQPAEAHRKVWLEGLHQELGASLEELRHRMDLHCLQASAFGELPEARRVALANRLEPRIRLWRETNLALRERLQELATEYILLVGGLAVSHVGRLAGLAELRFHLQGDDPLIRRRVWEERAASLEENRPALEDLLDELLALREQIARNADCDTWIRYRAAMRGLGPPVVPARPNPAQLGGRPAMARNACDMLVPGSPRVPGQLDSLEPALEAVTELLAYVSPGLSQTVRRMQQLGLLDVSARPGKFDMDACFWLPEHRLPLVRMSIHSLADDLCRFLRHLLAAHRALRAAAQGHPPERTHVPFQQADVSEARRLSQVLFSEWEATSARQAENRISILTQLEWHEALCRENWATWVDREPGASREARRAAWVYYVRIAWPELLVDSTEALADTLFLETLFFLPDWGPESTSTILGEALATQ